MDAGPAPYREERRLKAQVWDEVQEWARVVRQARLVKMPVVAMQQEQAACFALLPQSQ